MESSKIKNTLLITGNGFDLRCGLKSTYADFFFWSNKNNTKFKQLTDCSENQFGLGVCFAFDKDSTFTVWDLYFIQEKKLRQDKWCDVERAIKESLENTFWNTVFNQVNLLRTDYKQNKEVLEGKEKYYSLELYKRHFCNDIFLDPIVSVDVQITKSQFFDVLLKELKVFETRFATYISGLIEDDEKYKENQAKLLSNIIENTTSDFDFYLITFNYTPIYFEVDSLNLHGKLNSPIFGISNLTNQSIDERKFTKSFRRTMDHLQTLDSFLIQKNYHLIFYGTSFSNLDFDYYERIIRNYGNGIIYLCYSNYGGIDRKNEFIASIIIPFEEMLEEEFFSLIEKGKIVIKEISFDPT